jgi:predicted CXXCH cytochrome family protein
MTEAIVDTAQQVLFVIVFAIGATACRSERPRELPADPARTTPAPVPVATFVGSERCSGCHAETYAAWRTSHHGLAMQAPSETSMLGNFSDKVVRYFGEPTRFRRRGSSYEVETEAVSRESRGKTTGRHAYEVRYAFGVEPLQQYLVDIGDGHLQALPFAFDTRPKERGGGRWFHLHADEHVAAGDELHWSSPAYNWNKNCGDCHSTDLRRNYDPNTDRYDTEFAEISVGCEACHGAASRHVDQADRRAFAADKGWSRRFSSSREREWQFTEGRPIARLVEANADAAAGGVRRTALDIEACAPCHARRSDLGGASPDLHDRYRVELLEEPMYFADGQMRDEVFEYGSFVQSKMHAAGVVCGDCHEAHSGVLRASGNALCVRCHSGNTYDTPRHHFHPPDTPGSECVQCHMPSRIYMGVDERRDHRFGLPRPDLSMELGVPNACTDACHRRVPRASGVRRSVDEWAKGAIEQRFGTVRPKTFARALHAARNVRLGGANQLLEVAVDSSFPAIARATALLELRAYPESIGPSLVTFVRDASPLVRRALAQLVEGTQDSSLEAALARPLLSDEVRSVRHDAVRALLEARSDTWSDADRKALDRERDELRISLESNLDRPEALLDLARLELAGSSIPATAKTEAEAEGLLRRSIALDPTFAGAYLALADFLRTRGRDAAAVEVLERGIRDAGDRAPLEHALGFARVRLGDKRRALEHLRRAHDLAPSSVRFGLVYAVALHDAGERAKALALVSSLHDRFGGDLEVTNLLAHYRIESEPQARGKIAN